MKYYKYQCTACGHIEFSYQKITDHLLTKHIKIEHKEEGYKI